MKNVIVYTTDNCSLCLSAKALLKARGIEYEEINLARDPDVRCALARKTGMFSFPQILIDGETIGGFKELLEADGEGRLSELVAGAAPFDRPVSGYS